MEFRDLQIGDQFEFERLPYSHLIGGPFTKVSPRCYVRTEQQTQYRYRVGTVKVSVIKIESK